LGNGKLSNQPFNGDVEEKAKENTIGGQAT